MRNFERRKNNIFKKMKLARLTKASRRRLFKNPFFYFGATSLVLCQVLFWGSSSLAQANSKNNDAVFLTPFFQQTAEAQTDDPFFSQNKGLAIDAPDLKIGQDSFVYGISVPQTFSAQTFGNIVGGDAGPDQSAVVRKDIEDYTVQAGDTVQSVATQFGVSVNTILWANDLTSKSALKEGQVLTILPVSGAVHIVKSGDNVSQIAKNYKAKVEDVIAFNELANEGDIFIGDILVIPDGVVPVRVAAPSNNGQAPLPDSFFIFPAEGTITQGLHFFNGIDVANKCGTPVYAAAAGTVQRALGNGKWNFGMGNYITILHSNGVSTYYGHLMTLFVNPGEHVNTGDRIGLMGKTGEATGCHVHFQVMGGSNFLSKYKVGSSLSYK